VLLEDALRLAQMRRGILPIAALADGELQRLAICGGQAEQQRRQPGGQPFDVSHCFLPVIFIRFLFLLSASNLPEPLIPLPSPRT
jgi:hypothetical protein